MSGPTTRLSKSGQPAMGTTIDIAFTDGTWGEAKVVGKLYGKRGNSHLVGIFVEWPEGDRQRVDTVSDDFAHDIDDTWRCHRPDLLHPTNGLVPTEQSDDSGAQST